MAMLNMYYRLWIKFHEQLPDVDLVIDVSDPTNLFFKSAEDWEGLYSYNTKVGTSRIPVPDFSFLSWPESTIDDLGE